MTVLDFTFYAFMNICIVVGAYLVGIIVGRVSEW